MDEALSNIKITIIGNGSVGKTSLRRAYIGEKFRTNYIETIGSDFSFKSFDIDNTTIGLALWDLAGQDRFISVHPLFYKGSYGCVVVYSLADRSSFERVPEWIDRFMRENKRKYLPIMIVGNKIDLQDKVDDTITEQEHQIMVEKISKKYPKNTVLDFRTSARTGENVTEGFSKFGKKVYEWIMDNYSTQEGNQINLDDINQNIPGAYALVMNQIQGPQIIASHPSVRDNFEVASQLQNSTIKLIASLDFNDITQQSSIISEFPWIKPKGTYYYIAFTLDNIKARGKKELFLIGLNINRELSEPIAGIKGVLDGFLHNASNELARLVIESSHDLVTSKIVLEEIEEFVLEVEDLLHTLRIKTHESLKRWYNIPN